MTPCGKSRSIPTGIPKSIIVLYSKILPIPMGIYYWKIESTSDDTTYNNTV